MSRITDLQQRIQDTAALIRQMEKSVSASGPSVSASVLANIRSLEKRLAMLEHDLDSNGGAGTARSVDDSTGLHRPFAERTWTARRGRANRKEPVMTDVTPSAPSGRKSV